VCREKHAGHLFFNLLDIFLCCITAAAGERKEKLTGFHRCRLRKFVSRCVGGEDGEALMLLMSICCVLQT